MVEEKQRDEAQVGEIHVAFGDQRILLESNSCSPGLHHARYRDVRLFILLLYVSSELTGTCCHRSTLQWPLHAMKLCQKLSVYCDPCSDRFSSLKSVERSI